MLRDGDGVAQQDLVALELRGEERTILIDKGETRGVQGRHLKSSPCAEEGAMMG